MAEETEDLEFEIPDDSEISPEGKRLLSERYIKHDNSIWKISKNDPDDIFPGDPHADRIDKPEKLDLYTGKVYSKTNKKELRTLSKKAMIYIFNNVIMKWKDETIKIN